MSTSIVRLFGNLGRLLLLAAFTLVLTMGIGQTARAVSTGPAPVNLGTASSFVILTKTGITNVPTSAITGNLGTSPIAATAITGFSLILDGTKTFSRSSQVTGKIFAADYASPTPANLTVAVGDMQTAYTDAAGRTIPDFTELYAGNITGQTLVPGLYKWSTGVLDTGTATLAGPSNAVWIFQIAGDLTMGSGAQIVLSGGAQAKNIFWQVGGGTSVDIGTTAHVEGNILAAKAIHLGTGASLNGRALAQTAVTLQKNMIVIPPVTVTKRTMVFTSAARMDGWVRESGENTSKGGALNTTSVKLIVGDSTANQQYRSVLHFDTSALPAMAVITKVTLKVMKLGVVGKNPFTTHGALRADIRQPYFGSIAGLEARDFQAIADGPAATSAVFSATPVGNWYSADLNASARSFINITGATQFRLRFTLGDNNNHRADYVIFCSGNGPLACRPQLVVEYYVP